MKFLYVSNRRVVGRLLRLPLHLIPKGLIVPVVQGPLKGRRWTVGAGTHGCWLGTYEYEKQHLFADTIESGSVVYDIGANVGFYTLLASILVGPQGHVVSFEPAPRNLRWLKRHLRLNRIKNVTLVEAAVSDCSGETFFEQETTGFMGHLSTTGGKNAVRVATISLDELLEQDRIPVPHYLKIDVEGAEVILLRGAKKLLAAHKPTIFLATHGKQVHRECCDLLISAGYELKSVNDQSPFETDEIIATFSSSKETDKLKQGIGMMQQQQK